MHDIKYQKLSNNRYIIYYFTDNNANTAPGDDMLDYLICGGWGYSDFYRLYRDASSKRTMPYIGHQRIMKMIPCKSIIFAHKSRFDRLIQKKHHGYMIERIRNTRKRRKQ